MKKIIYLAFTALLCVSCFQVNPVFKGDKHANVVVKDESAAITKSFDFKDFDAICINGYADITFTQSDNWEVTLRTRESVLDHLDYKVEDGVLFIQTKKHRTIRVGKVEYDLTIQAPNLRRIEMNGAGDFELPAGLHTEGDLEIEVNGAGDIECKDITCNKLSVEINGLGDVYVSGKAEEAIFDVSGAGDIDASDLTVTGEVHRQSTSGLVMFKGPHRNSD